MEGQDVKEGIASGQKSTYRQGKIHYGLEGLHHLDSESPFMSSHASPLTQSIGVKT